MPRHQDLTGTDLHEPKGVANATAGSVYIADGLGSGDWTRIGYATGSMSDDGASNTITSSFQAVNDANFGNDASLTWAASNEGNGLSVGTTNGNIAAADAGVYLIHGSLVIAAASSVASEYQATVGIDSGSGIVTKEAEVLARRTTATADYLFALDVLYTDTLAAGDLIYLMLKRNSGTADIKLHSGTLSASRIV